jgi:hypothetical protein
MTRATFADMKLRSFLWFVVGQAGSLTIHGAGGLPFQGAAQTTRPTLKTKTSHGIVPWLVVVERQTSLGADASETKRLFPLNKNATEVGTPVAVEKLNQKIWLNCYAETRPQGYRKQGPMLN